MIDEQRIIDALVAQVLATSEERIITEVVSQVLRQKEEGQPNLVNRIRHAARERATRRVNAAMDAAMDEAIPSVVSKVVTTSVMESWVQNYLRTSSGNALLVQCIREGVFQAAEKQVRLLVEAQVAPIKDLIEQAVQRALQPWAPKS